MKGMTETEDRDRYDKKGRKNVRKEGKVRNLSFSPKTTDCYGRSRPSLSCFTVLRKARRSSVFWEQDIRFNQSDTEIVAQMKKRKRGVHHHPFLLLLKECVGWYECAEISSPE
mmetsp:Transcript_31157/g.61421  ORF Transcript_31157/g.61421 Transcript_31157/m.61421 type:complete len:113 (+) Transcript_31157:1075-1413(+)